MSYFEQSELPPLAESRAETVSMDHDTHEDDLASPAEILTHIQADLASLMRATKLSDPSCLTNPILPPPKAI